MKTAEQKKQALGELVFFLHSKNSSGDTIVFQEYIDKLYQIDRMDILDAVYREYTPKPQPFARVDIDDLITIVMNTINLEFPDA